VFDLPAVLDSRALLDKAFGRASKVTSKGSDRTAKARNLAAARVRIAGGTIESTLRGIVKGFPSLDRLPPFYRDLVDLLADANLMKKHLGAIDWAAEEAQALGRDYRRRIGRASGREIGRLRQEAYGRLASVVQQVGPDLEALAEARQAFRRIPEIDPDLPTIVVAGFPNVGKSSFVRAVSTGRPKVAAYPFTTKRVSLGHIDRAGLKIQILDTPGLLDRPMEKRNRLERQAIAALTHLADAVLFLLDPTETCGYPIEDQRHLLDEIRALFPDVPLVVVENKADLGGPTDGHPRISALRGKGVADALSRVLRHVPPPNGESPALTGP
jgi:nucleolar GTP-binding protein